MTSSFPALSPYGWSDRWATLYADVRDSAGTPRGLPDLVPARVVRHDGVALLLVTPNGRASLPVQASVEPVPVVGDWVVATHEIVVAVLHRACLLRRRDPGRDVEQPLVANVDVVFIVCGLDRPVKPGRIRRAAALAWDAGATPAVILTKADLASDIEAETAAVVEANPGLDIISTSAVTGAGLDELRAMAIGRTIVLLGESGAGKSSLTNALMGSTVADTRSVRRGDTKGRHTTTSRQLHPLPTGGVLVDTPGLRAVGLWIDEEAVSATFEDVETLAESCRFNDCAHHGEPGCAVAAAIEAGELAPQRLEAWDTFLREAESAARRSTPHEQRAYERRFGLMAKAAQRSKGRPSWDRP